MELDKDLQARQEARALSRRAWEAQKILGTFPQEKLDAIVEAMAGAFMKPAQSFPPWRWRKRASAM